MQGINKREIEHLLKEILNENPKLADRLDELKTHSPMMYAHDMNVSKRVMKMAICSGQNKANVKKVGLAGLMIDIGYINIPSDILHKSDHLTAQEFQLIKGHVDESVEIVKEIGMPEEIIEIVKTHHERINGGGYPNKLTRYNIPSDSMLLSLADAFEALTEERPYRNAYEELNALRMMYYLEEEEFTSEALTCLTRSLTGEL